MLTRLVPPERRLPATGVAEKLHDAFAYELDKLDTRREGGLQQLLADLVAGRVTEDPFPAEATARLRDFARDITRRFVQPLPPVNTSRSSRST